MKYLLITAATLGMCWGQTPVPPTPKSVVLTWLHTDPAVSFIVERAPKTCATTVEADFAVVGTTPVLVKTFTDANVSAGYKCYRVRAALAGDTSIPSNTLEEKIPILQPYGLTGTISIALKLDIKIPEVGGGQ